MKNYNKLFIRWGRRYLVLWIYAYCKRNDLWIFSERWQIETAWL